METSPQQEGVVIADDAVSASTHSKMKLDFDSHLETWLVDLAYLGYFAMLLGLACFFEDMHYRLMRFSFASGTLLLVIGVIFKKLTNNYYILCFSRMALIYHFEFAGFVREKIVVRRNEIEAIGIDSSESPAGEKEPSVWSYSMFFLHKNLQRTYISDFKSKSIEEMNEKIIKIAEVLKIKAYPAPDFHYPSVVNDASGKPAIVYKTCKTLFRENRTSVGFLVVNFIIVAAGILLFFILN